ncbi:MAG: BamA/TamA family outer membrane protein [Steroidobacteraceae bacterium]
MHPERRRPALLVMLLLALGAPAARANLRVEVSGVEGDVRRNVLIYLSVDRYRERTDVDADTMRRLFNRVDGEVKNALRPFGYYEASVNASYRQEGKDWLIEVRVEPGEPVRIRELSIAVTGPGAEDAAFDSIRNQSLLRIGTRLHHGSYEQLKGELNRIAAAQGYLAARMLRSEMVVDIPNHTAKVDLQLDTGPRYSFGAISIEQDVIRPGLMQRFLRFKEGDAYSTTELLRTQFALDDSLFFSQVEVEPGAADPETLVVPVRITAKRSKPVLSLGAGYGTDTGVRGTITWTNSRLNDRGHRFRSEIKASASTRSVTTRYDIPIGDPALEKFSIEGLHDFEEISDLDTYETTLRPSITRMVGRWQTVSSLSLTRTSTDDGQTNFTSNLLVPGFAIASVPEGYLGEAQFSRALYAEVIGSPATLGSDESFVRFLVQSERSFDLSYQWHLLLRGEAGASIVNDFSELPGIYRFFAGGDRSVRGFGYRSLSPEELVRNRNGSTELKKVGGRHLLVGSVEIVRDLPLNLALATFFDIGNAFNNFHDPLEYAAGVGLRYRLPGIAVGLDVAKPLSTGGNPRIHLNITPKL